MAHDSHSHKGRKHKPPRDDFAEHLGQAAKGAARTGTRKQVSINHLFEFSLHRDPPERPAQHRPSRRYLAPKHRPVLHGMRFINVNYKFVVDHRRAYRPQQLDPNIPVDTLDIIRIIVPRGNACPICLLDELVAPRMITLCGHILCLPCLLLLLESEVPVLMKRESKVIVEKYRHCPLCGSIIRKPEVKPVQIDNVDERFEVPRINDDVVLTQMTRAPDSIVPVPRWAEHDARPDPFPWVSPDNQPQFLRYLVASLQYVVAMYDSEKQQIDAAAARDKELYGDDGKFHRLALKDIDQDLQMWLDKFADGSAPEPHRATTSLAATAFYYYQTGFKCLTTYVLSPLDMKVLRHSYNQDYTQMPLTVVARVENIRYEELDVELVASKYKYLLHLPAGTQVGFLECNWLGNEYILRELWDTFAASLTKRTKASATKLKKEESNRRRALYEEERRAREFVARENDPLGAASVSLAALRISDHQMPTLGMPQDLLLPAPGPNEDPAQLTQTVWGTQIRGAEPVEEEDDGWDAEEMIRKAREEIARELGKKKKKKKLVLLSS